MQNSIVVSAPSDLNLMWHYTFHLPPTTWISAAWWISLIMWGIIKFSQRPKTTYLCLNVHNTKSKGTEPLRFSLQFIDGISPASRLNYLHYSLCWRIYNDNIICPCLSPVAGYSQQWDTPMHPPCLRCTWMFWKISLAESLPPIDNLLTISLTELVMKQKYQIDLINLYSF